MTRREQRERKLERQNERLEEFTSVVSHDLRNPLNVIQGSLDLIEKTEDLDHLDRSRRAAKRMEELIEELLTLAQQGKQIEKVDNVHLGRMVETCWETVERADSTLRIDTNCTIQAECSRLKQLLENLLRNAVEHGGDDVTIAVGELDENVGFYVEDGGPGIPEEDYADVFESGYSTSTDGTGFGLAIVNEAVKAHGWEIDITESDKGGARFEILTTESGDK
nr:HAMP domain-containing sensor histidine kinase [Halobellus litoreus]